MKIRSHKWKLWKWEQQNFRCPLCQNSISPSALLNTKKATIDHIRPRSHGGDDSEENLQITHKRCNFEKDNQCPGCEACEDGPEAYLLWRVTQYGKR
jgi:CRISPR/Cas system Type II protein with McrA/HNH and RuvC-like nuclease domain